LLDSLLLEKCNVKKDEVDISTSRLPSIPI